MEIKRSKRYNNPSVGLALIDVLIAVAVFYFVAGLLPLTNQNPFAKYGIPFCAYLAIGIFFGISFKKYIALYKQKLAQVIQSTFKADLLNFAIGLAILLLFPHLHYSFWVLSLFALLWLFIEVFLLSIYFAFHDAEIQHGDIHRDEILTGNKFAREHAARVDEDVRDFMKNYIIRQRGDELLSFLEQNSELFLTSTLLVNTTERFNVEKVSKLRYSSIINLHPVNDIREINVFFATINERLPQAGLFTGCYEALDQRKARIWGERFWLWGAFLFLGDFTLARVMPKLNLTRELYFWITGGKGRALSKAEVLGRAYFSGFEVINEFKVQGLSYFIARKIKEPLRNEETNYSIVLGLQRVGRGSDMFKVYKFRTMYPYSSYLQGYLYRKNNLREGGKFNQDFRITRLGHFMRRYWLDELPMIANLLKGNMKLVGVRPLSKQYFSLYSEDLQRQRVQHKPGLLPPFYADMPKTLDEIQSSEKRYLDECEIHGTFFTDVRYFVVILFNIFFRKARSK